MANRTNRVEHHGGSREAMCPKGKHVLEAVRLDPRWAANRLQGNGPLLDFLTEGETNDEQLF